MTSADRSVLRRGRHGCVLLRHKSRFRCGEGDGCNHAFNNYAESARLIQRYRVRDDFIRFRVGASARGVSAEHIYGLRGEPDMTHNRYAARVEKLDRRRHRFTAFKFHSGRAGLLKEVGGAF